MFKQGPQFHILQTFILKVTLFILIGQGWASAKVLENHQELRDAQLVTDSLIERYPADQFHILAIGRSPTLLLAYASLIHDFYMSQLPLSDFNQFSEHKQSIAGFEVNAISPKNLELLYKHFDLFIPSEKELNGRKLLVLDYAISGASLMSAFDYINDYLKLNGRRVLSGGVALSSLYSEKAQLKDALRKERFSFIKTISVVSYKHLNDALETSAYDRYSPYGRYEVGQNPSKEFNSDFFSLIKEFEGLLQKKNSIQQNLGRCPLFLGS